MSIQEDFNKLLACKEMVETKVFQEYFVKPLREYQSNLKDAYNCDTLTEMATLKGKKIGSDEFFKILKQIDVDFKNIKYEYEKEV